MTSRSRAAFEQEREGERRDDVEGELPDRLRQDAVAGADQAREQDEACGRDRRRDRPDEVAQDPEAREQAAHVVVADGELDHRDGREPDHVTDQAERDQAGTMTTKKLPSEISEAYIIGFVLFVARMKTDQLKAIWLKAAVSPSPISRSSESAQRWPSTK